MTVSARKSTVGWRDSFRFLTSLWSCVALNVHLHLKKNYGFQPGGRWNLSLFKFFCFTETWLILCVESSTHSQSAVPSLTHKGAAALPPHAALRSCRSFLPVTQWSQSSEELKAAWLWDAGGEALAKPFWTPAGLCEGSSAFLGGLPASRIICLQIAGC